MRLFPFSSPVFEVCFRRIYYVVETKDVTMMLEMGFDERLARGTLKVFPNFEDAVQQLINVRLEHMDLFFLLCACVVCLMGCVDGLRMWSNGCVFVWIIGKESFVRFVLLCGWECV